MTSSTSKVNKYSGKVLCMYLRRKAYIEDHLLKFIEPYSSLLEGYKKYILTIKNFIKKTNIFSMSYNDENKNYLRLYTRYGIYNSLYYSLEIEKILSPRKGARTKYLKYTPLRFISKFLPLFSFTFDSLMYSIYWGSKNYYLSNDIDDILLLKTKDPKAVSFSPFNFVEPKRVQAISKDENIKRLGISYLFNWLLPPISKDLTKLDEIWWESPFIYFDEAKLEPYLEILTINKTISYSNKDVIKILGRDLSWINVSKICKSNTTGGFEASLILRRFVLQPEFKVECHLLSLDKVSIIYDDDKEELGEGEDLLYTLMSIILRKLYLSSSRLIEIDKNAFIETLRNFLSQSHNIKLQDEISEQLGSRILSYNNIDMIVKALRVYHITEKTIIYLHPTLYEILFFLRDKDNEINVTYTNDTDRKLLNLLINSQHNINSPIDFISFANRIAKDFNVKEDKKMRFIMAFKNWPQVVTFSKIIKGGVS